MTKQKKQKGFIGFFARTRWYWAHLLAAIIVVLMIVWFLFWWLDTWTNHGESVTVPELIGLRLGEVERILDDSDLNYEIIDSASYDPKLKPLEVMLQDPDPGDKVKVGRSIYIKVNKIKPVEKSFPELLKGISYRSALSKIEGQGFVVKDIIEKPHKYKGALLSAQISGKEAKAGQKYPEGTKVVLYVGSGLGSQERAVPDLTGRPLSEAEFILSDYQLSIGMINYDNQIITSRDSAEAVIYKQAPRPTEEPILRVGETVDVWLTTYGHWRIISDTIRAGDPLPPQ